MTVAARVAGSGGPQQPVSAQAGPAAVLAAALEPGFLAEIGWDPGARVIAPPPGHRLLQDAAAGRGYARGGDLPGCVVPGCGRRVTGPGRALCREHRRQQHLADDLPLERFVATAAALPATGPCQVPACPRDRTSRSGYCEAHQYRLRAARALAAGSFDEDRWRVTASPVPVGEQVSLRGLPDLLAAEILYGLQQRTRAGLTTRLHMLRAVTEDLRRAGAASLLQAGMSAGPASREKRALLGSLSRYVRGGLGDTAAETARDVWDLSAFGASRGRLTFTGISQPWLRQSARRWAADDLPRRSGACPHARVQHIINAVARLSCHLRITREDHGGRPDSAAPTSKGSCWRESPVTHVPFFISSARTPLPERGCPGKAIRQSSQVRGGRSFRP